MPARELGSTHHVAVAPGHEGFHPWNPRGGVHAVKVERTDLRAEQSRYVEVPTKDAGVEGNVMEVPIPGGPRPWAA